MSKFEDDDLDSRLRQLLRPVSTSATVSAPAATIRILRQQMREAIAIKKGAAERNSLPEGLYKVHRRCMKLFRYRQRSLIHVILGELCEKYRAKHGWLFVPDGECSLRAKYAFRSRLRNQRVLLDERSIVSHVYAIERAYVASDTEVDPFYLRRNDATRSQLSAPVIAFGPGQQKRVIGVLDLESDDVGTFSAADAESLEIEAQKLAIPLLSLESLSEDDLTHWPSAPDDKGWVVDGVLKDTCDAFVSSLEGHDHVGDISATVWHVDWETESLWARATSGYDYDYLKRMLQMKSFTGKSVQSDRGIVLRGASTDPEFVERDKAEAMGLSRIASCPIYGVKSGFQSHGAVNVYQFHGNEPDILPSNATILDFSRLVSSLMTEFEAQRAEMACVHLDYKMRLSRQFAESSYLVPAQLHVLRDVLSECLHADGCSIFVSDETQENLNLVSSTGVRDERVERHEGRWVIRRVDPASYPLRDGSRSGLLKYLYWHPGSAIAVNSREHLPIIAKHRGPEFPSRTLLNGMEHLTPDTTDRRFLGIGIRLYEQTRVVVRVVRSTQSAPFTSADAKLLELLSELCRQNEFWAQLPNDGSQPCEAQQTTVRPMPKVVAHSSEDDEVRERESRHDQAVS